MAIPMKRIRGFVRDRCASAGVELAFGTLALTLIAVVVLDVHAAIRTSSAADRVAATVADYVSRESDGNYGDRLTALAQFLHKRELGESIDVVYVVSTIEKAENQDAEITWSDDSLRFGDPAATTRLAEWCATHSDRRWKAILVGPGATLHLNDEEAAVVTDVCASLNTIGMFTSTVFTGDIYRTHVLPTRVPLNPPQRPN